MKRKKIAAALLWALLAAAAFAAPARAAGEHDGEERQAELYHTLEERKEAGLVSEIGEWITLSGLLEVEAFYEDLDLEEGSETASDLELATVQLGLGVEVAEGLGAEVILLYEEGGGVDVDEATLQYESKGWFLRLGLQDLPTGIYPSHMVSGPLTEEIGETLETAVVAGYGGEYFEVEAFAANGDIDLEGKDDVIDDWGGRIILRPLPFVEVGASYFSDLADADAAPVETLTKRVGGWSLSAVIALGDFELLGEYLAAAERFSADDLDADEDGEGDRPRAWNFEAAWALLDTVEIALRLEGSDELAGEPERQYGACVSWSPVEHLSLSAEYLRGEFDEVFGEELRCRNLFTTQVALEF